MNEIARRGAELQQRGIKPEKQFTSGGGYTGPILADIVCPDGTVYATVDPAVSVAQVRVLTEDGPGSPAAEAARNTRIDQSAERLVISVPEIPGGGGSVMSSGGGRTIINGVHFTGNVSVVNGQVMGGSAGAFTRGIEVHVTLPPGSAIKYNGKNGSLHAYGTIAAIKGEASNGSIHAQTVGRIEAEAGNGSIKVDTILEWIDAEASNGSVKISDYRGRTAKVRAGNGSVNFTVAPSASGRIDIKASNGSVKVFGVRNRSDLDVRATAGNGTVKKM